MSVPNEYYHFVSKSRHAAEYPTGKDPIFPSPAIKKNQTVKSAKCQLYQDWEILVFGQEMNKLKQTYLFSEDVPDLKEMNLWFKY